MTFPKRISIVSVLVASVGLAYIPAQAAGERVGPDPPLPEDSLGLSCMDDTDCPNESVCRAAVCYVPKNRYVSFVPVTAGGPVAFQVTSPSCPDMIRWVGEPGLDVDDGCGAPVLCADMARLVDAPFYLDTWLELVHVGDEEIHPGARYEIRATLDGALFTDPLILPTPRVNADMVGRFVDGAWQPPNGLVNFDDLQAQFQAFEMRSTAPPQNWMELDQTVPDACICSDYHWVVIAFEDGRDYIFSSSCECGSAEHCSDDAFCNGAESCGTNDVSVPPGGTVSICAPDADPCPDQLCDEASDTCAPCQVDADCNDGLFCNGAERCDAGICARAAYSCGDQGCKEESDECAPTSGPTMSLVPVSAPGGNPDFDANRVFLDQGGVQVTLEVRLWGWDVDLSGDPLLHTWQATVDASGYLGAHAAPPLPGVDLAPVGYPDDPESGLDIDATRPDFVFGDLTLPSVPISAVSWATLDYRWGSTILGGADKADDGLTYYLGSLILEVPVGAAGIYTITLDPHVDFSFLNEPDGTRIPGLTLVPALIIFPSDCNDNGVPDADDVASGTSDDCNHNWLPDECDLTHGISTDCNANDLPDDCEPFVDCNINGVRDPCDISEGTSGDCNSNTVPDDCESAEDCNHNDVQDICDLAASTSKDCNFNDTPDECDISGGTSEDLNTNGIPDECDAAPAAEPGGPACDVASDCSGAWAGADCVGGTCYVPKNRYLSIDPTTNADPVAYRVEFVESAPYPTAVGRAWWLDVPICYDRDGNALPSTPPDADCSDSAKFGWVSHLTAAPVTRLWQEAPLNVNDCGIVPVAGYEVRSSPDDGATFSAPLRINTIHDPEGDTQSWGDITAGPVDGMPGLWLPPERATNMADVGNAIRTFEKRSEDTGYPPCVWVDLEANHTINMGDIQFLIMAFEGESYAGLNDLPFIGIHPVDCP